METKDTNRPRPLCFSLPPSCSRAYNFRADPLNTLTHLLTLCSADYYEAQPFRNIKANLKDLGHALLNQSSFAVRLGNYCILKGNQVSDGCETRSWFRTRARSSIVRSTAHFLHCTLQGLHLRAFCTFTWCYSVRIFHAIMHVLQREVFICVRIRLSQITALLLPCSFIYSKISRQSA